MKTPNGTLNANLASEPDALDPALSRSLDGACLTLLAFSGLYSYNEEGSLVPELSDGEPEVSEDGLSYTFKIKDGLKWSDGETLDAEDRQDTNLTLPESCHHPPRSMWSTSQM